MAAKAKKRIVTPRVPQSMDEAEAMLRELGQHRLAVEKIDTQLKAKTQKAIQQAKDLADPISAKIEDIEAGLTQFANVHRQKLTGGKGKKGRMKAGYFDWRTLPASVTTRKVPMILASIQDDLETFGKFLRTKVTLDKEAMRADPDLALELPGVSIGSEGERIEIVIYENTLKD